VPISRQHDVLVSQLLGPAGALWMGADHVTGASRGFGLEIVGQALERGDAVVWSPISRRVPARRHRSFAIHRVSPRLTPSFDA